MKRLNTVFFLSIRLYRSTLLIFTDEKCDPWIHLTICADRSTREYNGRSLRIVRIDKIHHGLRDTRVVKTVTDRKESFRTREYITQLAQIDKSVLRLVTICGIGQPSICLTGFQTRGILQERLLPRLSKVNRFSKPFSELVVTLISSIIGSICAIRGIYKICIFLLLIQGRFSVKLTAIEALLYGKYFTKSDVWVQGWHEHCNSSVIILTFSDIEAYFEGKNKWFDILTRLKKPIEKWELNNLTI